MMDETVRWNMKKVLSTIGDFDKQLIFSEELFLAIYDVMREKYSLYNELADMNDLYEIDEEDFWSKRGTSDYYRLTKIGFINVKV